MINEKTARNWSFRVDEEGFDNVVEKYGVDPETLGRYLRIHNKNESDKAMEELKEAVLKKPKLSTSTWADGPKVLSIDIETLPAEAYVWGCGKQYVGHKQIIKGKDWSILSFAAKWMCGTEIFGDVLDPYQAMTRDDSMLCEQLWPLLDEADIIIAHNGDKFDVRKINSRLIANGLLAPPSTYQTIDTLLESRKVFAHTSHTQDYLTKLFKLPEKLKTEYELWIECACGNQDSLDRMFEYNKGDIQGLEELYFKIRPWMRKHPNFGLYYDEDHMSRCPKCGTTDIFWGQTPRDYYYTPMGRYRTFRCNECGSIGRDRLTDITKEERAVLVSTVAK